MGFHMFCHADRDEAYRIARPNVDQYFASLIAGVEADAGWGQGTSPSDNYPGYDEHMKKLRETSFDSILESGSILAGTPDDINQQLRDYIDVAGEFEYLSMQVNFHMVSGEDTAASMRLFSEQVMPNFRN